MYIELRDWEIGEFSILTKSYLQTLAEEFGVDCRPADKVIDIVGKIENFPCYTKAYDILAILQIKMISKNRKPQGAEEKQRLAEEKRG